MADEKKNPNDYPRVIFRVTQTMQQELESRASHDESTGVVARRDLERYYAMLRRALPVFSEAEALCLHDALNGHLPGAESVHLLWAEVSDALDEGLAEKWEIDGVELVVRLRKLPPFECMAVVDALERAWGDEYHVEDMGERLRQAGLVKL